MAMLTSRRVIPQEICGLICQNPILTQPDLYSLSLLSRAFRTEAERLLHVSVELSGGKRKIKSFCVKIIRQPHLVTSLHTLIIHMPPQGDLQAADLVPITKVLRLCTGLKHLHVLHDGPKWMQNGAGTVMRTRILDGHAFKLRTFVTTYFSQLVLAEFLVNQSSIDTLVMETSRPSSARWSISLPNLKKLSCPAQFMWVLTEMPEGKEIKLEQLHLTFLNLARWVEHSILPLLRNYRKTLRSLSITRYQNEEGQHISSLIESIATQLPDIKFLRIMDLTGRFEGKKTTLSNHVIHDILPSPCGFSEIETLILHSPMVNYDMANRNPAHMISAYPDLRSKAGRLRVADRIMRILPMTLTRLVLVARELAEFTRDDVTGLAKLSIPSSDNDPNEWPRYDNTIEAYRELWKSEWCPSRY